MASPIKDTTSTSFGLAIAFLLPGFCGFFALSFWSPHVAELFTKFLEAESNIGRFLLVIICSLIAGLEISVFRWILFEQWLCKKSKLDRSQFSHLSVDAKLTAFRAAVDEHYRYHQFWGGMAIAIPFIGFGLVRDTNDVYAQWGLGCGFLLVEIVTIVAARSAFKNYVDRATNILEGFDYAQRMGETPKGRPPDASDPDPDPATATATATSSPATASETSTPKEMIAAMPAEGPCGVTGASTPEAAIGTDKSTQD